MFYDLYFQAQPDFERYPLLGENGRSKPSAVAPVDDIDWV
jgi:hypothetical protein